MTDELHAPDPRPHDPALEVPFDPEDERELDPADPELPDRLGDGIVEASEADVLDQRLDAPFDDDVDER